MKTRALLTIIVSLITGFLIGFLVSSQITRLRTRDVRSMSSAETLKMRTYDLIKPTPEQMEKLNPIVIEYSARFDSVRHEAHNGFKSLVEDYHESLSQYLNENQIEILNNFAKGLKRKPHDKKHRDSKKKPRDRKDK